MRKLELVKAHRMELENEHLKAYKRYFPNARPSIFQMELIEAWVTDPEAWNRTLVYWAGNDYRPQSVFKMLEYYRQVRSGTVQTFEDTTKVKMRVGASTETEPLEVQCSICHDIGQVWDKGGMVPCQCRKAA